MPEMRHRSNCLLINRLDDSVWQSCERAIQNGWQDFGHCQTACPRDYTFTILLAQPSAPMLQINDGYSGDGGIPGYLFLSLVPNGSIPYPAYRQPSLMKSIIMFAINLLTGMAVPSEMLVAEGFDEIFVKMYGKEKLGPWVSKTVWIHSIRSSAFLHNHLDVKGVQKITAYLYGDEIAALMGQERCWHALLWVTPVAII